MGFKTEYVVDRDGNYNRTYDEIRIRTEEDPNGDKVVRIEQGGDTLLVSEDQFKDFYKILELLDKG